MSPCNRGQKSRVLALERRTHISARVVGADLPPRFLFPSPYLTALYVVISPYRFLFPSSWVESWADLFTLHLLAQPETTVCDRVSVNLFRLPPILRDSELMGRRWPELLLGNAEDGE